MGSVEKYLANGSPDEFGDFDLWGLEICKRAASRYNSGIQNSHVTIQVFKK
jgi:hypothetical protein